MDITSLIILAFVTWAILRIFSDNQQPIEITSQQISQLAAMFPDVEPSILARELAASRGNVQVVIDRVLSGQILRRIPQEKSNTSSTPKEEPILTEAPKKVWEQDAKKRSENLRARAAWMKQQARQKMLEKEMSQ